MNLRHSLSLTVSSVTLILKVLLYTTVLFLIAFALFMAITEPIIESFGSEFDMIAELQEDFSAMLQRGDNGPLQNFISSNSDELVTTVILYILLFLFDMIRCVQMIGFPGGLGIMPYQTIFEKMF